jgi:hypothetical protein
MIDWMGWRGVFLEGREGIIICLFVIFINWDGSEWNYYWAGNKRMGMRMGMVRGETFPLRERTEE